MNQISLNENESVLDWLINQLDINSNIFGVIISPEIYEIIKHKIDHVDNKLNGGSIGKLNNIRIYYDIWQNHNEIKFVMKSNIYKL